jgi:hypothetical protein
VSCQANRNRQGFGVAGRNGLFGWSPKDYGRGLINSPAVVVQHWLIADGQISLASLGVALQNSSPSEDGALHSSDGLERLIRVAVMVPLARDIERNNTIIFPISIIIKLKI